MAKQYLINFLLCGHSDAIEFEVREHDWIRAQDLFEQSKAFDLPRRFLVFDTVEGMAVAISVPDVQLVRFLWNPLKLPSDQKHYDGYVQVSFRGREEAVTISPVEEEESLSAFFVILDGATEQEPFTGLTDMDGEISLINMDEIVLVTAPLHEVNRGHRKIRRDIGADPDGDLKDIPF